MESIASMPPDLINNGNSPIIDTCTRTRPELRTKHSAKDPSYPRVISPAAEHAPPPPTTRRNTCAGAESPRVERHWAQETFVA